MVEIGCVDAFMGLYLRARDILPVPKMRDIVWACGNFVKGDKLPPFEKVQFLMDLFIEQYIRSLLLGHSNLEYVTESAWALRQFTGHYDQTEYVWAAGVPQITLQKMRSSLDSRFLSSTLRILGDFVAEDRPYDVELVNLGLVETIILFLDFNDHETLKRETIWTLSNVAAGNQNLKMKLASPEALGVLFSFFK